MSRGLFVFVIQAVVSTGVIGLGVWALAFPGRLQHFIHSNFALLPDVKHTLITPVLLRVAGAFVLWYGYILLLGLRQELTALGMGWLFA
jgi:hypothetical protein